MLRPQARGVRRVPQQLQLYKYNLDRQTGEVAMTMPRPMSMSHNPAIAIVPFKACSNNVTNAFNKDVQAANSQNCRR